VERWARKRRESGYESEERKWKESGIESGKETEKDKIEKGKKLCDKLKTEHRYAPGNRSHFPVIRK
jgi:hypothetical protein